jgi:heavy metal sensor kinase
MSPWARLPARIRLTLWYVLLLAATQAALGLAIDWLLEQAIYDSADDLLRTKATAVQTEVDVVRSRVSLDTKGTEAGEMPPIAVGLDLVRLWDRDQRLVYETSLLAGLPTPDAEALARALDDRPEVTTARAADGTPVRLYLEAAYGDRKAAVGVIQVGRSDAEIEALLARMRLLKVGGLAAALLLACGGGYFLAGRALAPVDRITAAAERIGAEDLSRRLALRLPNDELGRLVRAFDGMIDRLDRAFQRQRQFTADASHELRTPLAIIRSEVELARGRARRPAEDARVLESVAREADRLVRLVEDLLTLARADAGQELLLGPLDLEEAIAEAGERIAPLASAREVRLVVTIDEAPPVRGDAVLLGRLLLNLLDNAVRHTPPGGEVRLSLGPAPDGALLRVADTGEGIPAEHLPRIFERFYRADPARGRAAGGSGLGLAICDWIARAHGGQLEVASQPGRGTTFTLRLPAAPPPASQADRAKGPTSAPTDPAVPSTTR